LNSINGLISGTPTTAGPSSFTVQVTDANGATASQPLSITINLVITTTSPLPIGFVGFPYVGATFTAPGGAAPYTWSVSSGSLPVGLLLNSATGKLSGTPTIAGTSSFIIKVVDSKGNTATATFALTVTTITANGPLVGEVSAPYSLSFTVSPPTPPPTAQGYYYWAVSGPSGAPCSPSCLPAGLSLNSATGQITGTPTAAGTSNFGLEVIFEYTSTPTAQSFYYAVQTFTLTINPALTITTTSPLPSGDVSANYSQTFTATGGVPLYNWSVSAGNLPVGLSLNSATGQLTGTPTTPAPPITLPYTSNFTVQVSDSAGGKATATFALTINPLPVITTTSPLPGGTVGTYYSQGVTVSGGTAPYYWALDGGALPPGLSLDSASCPPILTAGKLRPGPGQGAGRRTRLLNPGARAKPAQDNVCLIVGTPARAVTANFTMVAVDSDAEETPPAQFSLTISAPPVLTITTTSPLPSGDVGALYSQTFAATGGVAPYLWSVSAGSLPGGLSLSSTGQLTGTPTAAGTSNFTVQAADSYGDSATATFALTINSAPAITTTSPLPGGFVGANYSQGVTVSGGTAPFYWGVTLGTLPSGLSLDSASCPPITRALVEPGPSQSAAKRTRLPNSSARVKPHQAPPANVCLIDGTPQTAGTSNFTMTVKDAAGATASAQFSLTVSLPLPLIITTTSPLPSSDVGVPYSLTFTATGGTGGYNWSLIAGTLPSGLSLTSGGTCGVEVCTIAGTPTAAGTSNFTVQVVDSAGDVATAPFTLTINLAPAITTSSPLPGGDVGAYYSQAVTVSGGTAPYRWEVSAGALPAGLNLDSSCLELSNKTAARRSRLLNPGVRVKPEQAPPSGSCLIDGTPTTQGSSNFTMLVQDYDGETATAQFTLTINPLPAITTASPLPGATLGANYSQGVTVSGGTAPFGWALTAGSLPAGLSLDSASCPPISTGGILRPGPSQSAGRRTRLLNSVGRVKPGQAPPANVCLIVGTPTTAETSNFTMQVQDSYGETASAQFALTVNLPPAITTSSPLKSGTVGVAYAQTVVATGGTPPLLWAVTIGTLPMGLALNSANGQISGLPTTVGTSNFTIQVTDVNLVTASKPFALTINSAPTITTTSPLPAGTVGANYLQTVTATGGTPPLLWAKIAGALPAGLSLNSGNGQISGTPTTAGTSSFTIQATDANGATATKAFTLTVNPAPTITTNSPLPAGTVGANYLQTLAVSGGTLPFTWTTVPPGTLPAGLTLSSTGQISGMPTTAGPSTFTVQAKDFNGATTTKSFTLTINPAPVITTNSPLPAGTVGANYSLTLAVSGGTLPFTWTTVPPGTLPAGLTLSSTGQISGTPTTAINSNFTVQVKDFNGATATKSFSLTINPVPVILPPPPIPPCTVGAVCPVTVRVSGGTPPYVWTVSTGVLPPGLALNSVTGQISGTPTTAGIFNFTVRVTDANGATASQSITLTVNPAPVITTKSLLAGTVGASYSQTVTATGGTPPLVWSVLSPGALPAGLSLNTGTGQISGTPTTGGTSSFTIQLTDANGATATASFTLTINPSLAITTTSPLPTGTVGGNYSQTLTATGGTAPLSWTVATGTLPPGLTLNSTGQITGTPTTAATSNFTAQVKDVNGATASKTFALAVNPAPVITTNSPLPTGTVGVSYLQALTVTGGSGQYTWTVSVGALPAGLVLNSAAGQISGTPTTSGPSSFTIQVTDSNQVKATKAFTVTINAALTIITYSPLPAGMVGAVYSVPMIATGGTAPYTWTVSGGALPAGLSLNSVQGRIGGTPTTAGNASFSIQVSDSQGLTATKSLSLTITGVLVITTSAALPAGTVSANYSQTVQATGGAAPYIWALIGGSLPAGLSLNSATGAISGTPTASGHASFTIRITDANQATTTAAFALTVNPPPAIKNQQLPNPIVGASYSQTVSVSGGTGPFTFTVTKGALPPGLSLNSTTGLISGTPTASGPVSFTITVTDSNGVIGSQSFSPTTSRVTITTTSPLPGGTEGIGYAPFTLLATGGTQPYIWKVSVGALPAGLSLNSATGQIGGQPAAGGTANFTIQVTDANGVIASAPFTLAILSSTIVTPVLPIPVLGSFYSAQLLPPVPGAAFTWSLSAGSSLPPGLTLSSAGLISGTPVALGSFTVTVQATDSSNNTTTTITFPLTVKQAPFTLTIQVPPGTPQPQFPITVTLAQAYPVDLTGELVLQFTPNPAAPVIDPAIGFNTVPASDTVSFTIPKGQTSAVFTPSPLLVQTGTVAGTIVFTASLTADGVPLTPTTAVTLDLPQEPPVIASVTIQQVTSGFNVRVTGYSNTREITQATFTFTAQPGSQVQSTSFTPADVASTFQTWYASPASNAFGSQFTYTQPFTITAGTSSALQSVTVTLTNSLGASSSMTANF
jgi:hypothetical protein